MKIGYWLHSFSYNCPRFIIESDRNKFEGKDKIVARILSGPLGQPTNAEILEDAFFGDITLLVVNARHMKNAPGKKRI